MTITRAQLMEYGRGTTKGRIAESYRGKERASAGPSIFLSHSHADKDIVEPAANFFASLGVSVYVDWLDPNMPAITNAQTANTIKLMIQVNKRFVVLATERSLQSRWVPWELGYADGEKKLSDIAILPIAEDLYRDAPNEYIQVYSEIAKTTNNEWYVFGPGETKSFTSLKDWLLR